MGATAFQHHRRMAELKLLEETAKSEAIKAEEAKAKKPKKAE
jgi:hypothetical protein